jgi:hypothetical protein
VVREVSQAPQASVGGIVERSFSRPALAQHLQAFFHAAGTLSARDADAQAAGPRRDGASHRNPKLHVAQYTGVPASCARGTNAIVAA